MKYVILYNPDTGKYHPAVFSEHTQNETTSRGTVFYLRISSDE